MAAYVIANVDVQDLEGYEKYRGRVSPTFEPYGGRYVVRGGRYERLEGDWDPKRVVVIEFDSVERAKAWWASEEYREAKAPRQRTATSSLIVVEGV